MKLRVSLSLLAGSAGLVIAGLASAGSHVAPAGGAVPGAPFLVVSDKADVTHCGGRDVRIRALSGHGAGTEPELVAAMTLDTPRGLDFDPRHKAAAQASEQRFSGWLTEATKRMGAARAVYTARAADGKVLAANRIAAAARLVQLERHFADTISFMEVPRSVRTGPYAADTTAAFCDALTDKADPLYDQADLDAAACRKARDDAKLGPGWWDLACAAP